MRPTEAICDSFKMQNRFVARSPTQRERNETVEYRRFLYLKEAATRAAREDADDFRYACCLGYSALKVEMLFGGEAVPWRSRRSIG